MTRAAQILIDPTQALAVPIHGRDLQIGCALKDVQGLSTRRRTGIEHALPGSGIQVGARQLRTGILHRDQALREPRQAFDGTSSRSASSNWVWVDRVKIIASPTATSSSVSAKDEGG